MPHPSITAETYPHKPAIIMGGTGEMVTYQQLDERSNQGAQLFRALGLKTGDHIGMMMENNRQFLEIVWAAQRSGLVFTPIGTHIDEEDAERRRVVFLGGRLRQRLFSGRPAVGETVRISGVRFHAFSWLAELFEEELVQTVEPPSQEGDSEEGDSEGRGRQGQGTRLTPPSFHPSPHLQERLDVHHCSAARVAHDAPAPARGRAPCRPPAPSPTG